jgi:hypothetical protein
MEAAGAPRLDVERLRLVRRSTRGAGQRGPWRRDKSRDSLPAYAGAVAEERSARRLRVAWVRPTARSGRWRIELFIRPVLKHGPRSLTCMRAGGRQTH